MNRKISVITGCLVLILILLFGCIDNTPQPMPTSTPGDDNRKSTGSPQVIDAISTSNTSVLIVFSNAMGESVEDASRYMIAGSQICDNADWSPQLGITDATASADGTSVTLTTLAQTGTTYRLKVTGVEDHAGLPLVFSGTPPSEVVDSDEDGISDADEQQGWAVRTVLKDGTQLCKDVTSDPENEDTDSDGVNDNVERANSTNPRSNDTDGDQLTDLEEIGYTGKLTDRDSHKEGFYYASSPVTQDTDQDGIIDGMEAIVYKTSPALQDTDGDGMNDFEEIATGGRDPRQADLPQLDLELFGDPAIILNITEGTRDEQISNTLKQNTSEFQKTDTESTRMAIENTIKLHTEVEVGTSNWPPSANAKLTTDTEFSHSHVNETSSSWTQGSVEDVKNTFETMTSANTTYHNGIIAISMKLVNNSSVTFKLEDPRVIAYRMTPGGNFSVVGTLEPGKLEISDNEQQWVPAIEANEYVLGPGEDASLILGAGDLPAQVMKALMQNPSALMFEIGSYSMFQLDEFGVQEMKNYSKIGEDVLARTGVIVIDYGDGRVERYTVATNTKRNSDGSGYGLTLKEVLTEILGIEYQVCDYHSGALCRLGIEMVDSDLDGELDRYRFEKYGGFEEPNGYWLVSGTQQVFDSAEVENFEEIVVKSGDRVSLVWVEDKDGDGLSDREEYLLGTDIEKTDTDGDGLSDFYEAKEGWEVQVATQTPYSVLPDPRFADSDGDGWMDKYESDAATDPYVKDTDGDDVKDPYDLYPLSGPCMENRNNKLKLVAWWIPWYGPYGRLVSPDSEALDEEPEDLYYAKDIWAANDYSKPGELFGYQQNEDGKGIIIEYGNDTYFSLNRGINTDDQYILVEEQKDWLSPKSSFTLAAWIIWDGELASGEDRATLVTKGNQNNLQYAVYIKEDGSIQFDLRRHVNETKRGFGCNPCWKEFDHDEQVSTEPNLIKKRTLHHVVVTFDWNHMKIYIDGVKQRDYDVRNKHRVGWGYWYEKFTDYLLTNQEPLVIGNFLNGSALQWPFKGMILEVQFFDDDLIEDDVAKLYKYGICVPEH